MSVKFYTPPEANSMRVIDKDSAFGPQYVRREDYESLKTRIAELEEAIRVSFVLSLKDGYELLNKALEG